MFEEAYYARYLNAFVYIIGVPIVKNYMNGGDDDDDDDEFDPEMMFQFMKMQAKMKKHSKM